MVFLYTNEENKPQCNGSINLECIYVTFSWDKFIRFWIVLLSFNRNKLISFINKK
jgi:hypothetical protein